MVNVLEYVFLVRNVDDLDKEKIETLQKKRAFTPSTIESLSF